MTELMGVKRDYRAVSYALCSAIVGVILMRVIVWFLPSFGDGYGAELASDAVFTLPVQLVFFLAVPFCIYKFYGRRTVRAVLDYSSCKGFKPWFLLAIPLGFCVWVVTLGVSSAWAGLLDLTGYNSTSSSAPLPETFSAGFFIAEVLMTACLPAVCEEFCMRGGVLTTARTTFKTIGCVVFCGIAFGLFHQNVRQVFYTALFGALAAFITIKTKSIFPAMIMHFTNNFCSVFFDYAAAYDWAFFGGFFDMIDTFAATRVWALVLLFMCVIVIGGGIAFCMIYLCERKVVENKMRVIRESGFDVTNKRVVLMGEFDEKKVGELEMEKEVYGADYAEIKFKPSARDIMIIVALGAVALCTTVFTYVWGFFY